MTNIPTLTGVLQYNFDTNHLELASESIGLRAQSTKGCPYFIFQSHPHFLPTDYRTKKLPCSPSGLKTHQNDSQNSGKCYAYNYNFITNQDQSNEETHRARSGRVLNAELPCPLIIILCSSLCSPTRKLQRTLVSRVLTGILSCRHI